MYWQDESGSNSSFLVPDDVIDLSFKISCKALPVDHGKLLADQLLQHIPWLVDDPIAGVHSIHSIDSGNGWEKPTDPDALVYPSKRTPLVLRLPRDKIAAAKCLEGISLEIDHQPLQLHICKERKLLKTTTLYARYVAMSLNHELESEETFINLAMTELQKIGVSFKKILCGKSNHLRNGEKELHTRSLVIADLSFEDSIKLQERGVGYCRHMGCGLFIPHKSI